MEFVHIFLIYLLTKEESDYKRWQYEALYNEEIVAQSAYNPNTRLIKDDEKITMKKWALEILDEISHLNNVLNLNKEEIINKIRERILNSKNNYGKQLIKIIENKGFINSNLSIAINNKETSHELIDIETIKNNEKLYYYYTTSLPNKKI